MQTYGVASGVVGTAPKQMYYGIYTATVVSTADPTNQGRIQLKIPQVLGTATSHWALPILTNPVLPAINSVVYAQFIGGDVNHPIYHCAQV